MTTKPTEAEGWFARKENVRKILYGLFGACVLLVVVDVIYWLTDFDKHLYLQWEKWPGFQAVYAFVGSVALVLIAKYVLRPLVMRGEDYYEKGKPEDDINA